MREMTHTPSARARAVRYRELAAKMQELAAASRTYEARTSYLALCKCWNSLAEGSERAAELELESLH